MMHIEHHNSSCLTSYCDVTMLCSQPIILILLDIPPMLPVLDGVVMELQDCALPILKGKPTPCVRAWQEFMVNHLNQLDLN